MADEEKEKDDFGPDDQFEAGTDWGKDWESAFQAEDELFFTEDGTLDDFNLDALEKSQYPHADQQEAAPGTVPPGAAETDETVALPQADADVLAEADWKPDRPSFISRLLAFGPRLKEKFQAIPPKKKIIFSGLPVLVFGVAAILFFIIPTGKKPQEIELDMEQFPAGHPAPLPSMPEQIRRKWELAPFYIPIANTGPNEEKAFIDVKITLIMVQNENIPLPLERERFLRDLIYQFYVNRPLYELQRYTLARGEMSRKLRKWIRKQWPDVPLETIQFNHYKVT